tara:strand:- start:491 stop:748 length:258 start_codon:yes stop_codon:yes gene_type:complete
MKKKKDVFIKSSVHTWNTNLKDQMEDWAKMFVEARKNKKVISRGTHYHYVNSKPRLCASASAMPVIVLSKKQQDKFFKKKVRKKK